MADPVPPLAVPPSSFPAGVDGVGELGEERAPLLVDEHFAAVPEWVLDSPVSDCAVRLYAVLLRYGQTSGARMPSRATLARRLRKGSVDTVDRAMKELVGVGAVSVERRVHGGVCQTNRYHLRTRRPGGSADSAARRAAVPPLPGPERHTEPTSPGPEHSGDLAVPTEGGRTDAAHVPVAMTAEKVGTSWDVPTGAVAGRSRTRVGVAAAMRPVVVGLRRGWP